MYFSVFEGSGTRSLRTTDELVRKAAGIKAFIFDWDGVFNGGFKDAEGGSPFSEVGSMGVNLVRFAAYLKNGTLPFAAVITGQHNPHAERFVVRERMHGLYMGFTDKRAAFDHFCATHQVKPEEVAFVFDDVLDLSVAAQVGLRIMIGHAATRSLQEAVIARNEVDVITAQDGANHGLREACDLMTVLMGQQEKVLEHRVAFDATYQTYLELRKAITPQVTRKER